MRAVWADEPMHTRVELARLVWELRKKLAPLGAEHLIESERGLGYRLVTSPEAESATPSVTGRARGRLTILVAIVIVAAVLGFAAVVWTTRPGGDDGESPALRTFVGRIENVLAQSAAGRLEAEAVIRDGLDCSLPAGEAARQIASVADNRQSILVQLGSFATPAAETGEIVTRLQRALQESIEADRHYRDGFAAAAEEDLGCPLPRNSDFVRATRSDARATAAKRRFVRAFNPLARRFAQKTWSAHDI
jgi:hypothetical protein